MTRWMTAPSVKVEFWNYWTQMPRSCSSLRVSQSSAQLPGNLRAAETTRRVARENDVEGDRDVLGSIPSLGPSRGREPDGSVIGVDSSFSVHDPSV